MNKVQHVKWCMKQTELSSEISCPTDSLVWPTWLFRLQPYLNLSGARRLDKDITTLSKMFIYTLHKVKHILYKSHKNSQKFWNQFCIQDSTLSTSRGSQGFQLSTKRLKRKNTFTNVTRMTILKIPFLKALHFTIVFYKNEL